MSDNNIYDVDNYEEVSNERSSLENTTKEDYIEEDTLLEKNTTFDMNKSNGNNKKEKKKGSFKIIAIALIAGLLGGIIGGGSIYYGMKDSNIKNQSSNLTPNPQTFNTQE
ncbi:serine protease, partial [Clostridium perfringens]|nr:serine protease [Clostridium perfringens]